MLFYQHTPTECMIHKARMLEKYFNDILLNIAYIIIVCYFCSSLLLFFLFLCLLVLSLFLRPSRQTHTPISGCFAGIIVVFVLCMYYFVCFRTPTFLLLLHSYFPAAVSCLLRCFLFSILFWISAIVTTLFISLQISWSVSAAIIWLFPYSLHIPPYHSSSVTSGSTRDPSPSLSRPACVVVVHS